MGASQSYYDIPMYGMGTNATDYAAYMQYLQAMQMQQAASGTTSTQSTGTTSNPTFGQVQKVEEAPKGNAGVAIFTTVGAITAGAALVILSKGKADAKFFSAERWKTGWEATKGWFKGIGKKGSEVASEASRGRKPVDASALLSSNALKEYTIIKDGVTITMKDGKPIKIVTEAKKVINNPTEITGWLNKNKAIETEISNALKLTKSGALPKDTRLVFTRKIGNKEFLIENGQIKELRVTDKTGAVHTYKGKDLHDNITRYLKPSEITEATSISKNMGSQTIQVLDKKGNLIDKTGKLEVTVSQGKVVKAKLDGRDLKPEELKALQKTRAKEFQKFGREVGKNYTDLPIDWHYLYAPKGGNVYKLNKAGNVTEIATREVKNTHTTTDAIEKFMNKHSELQKEVESVTSSGILPEKWRFGNIIFESSGGNTCRLAANGNKLEAVKLTKDFKHNGRTYKKGTEITGDVLAEWQKIAENRNAIEDILNLLK